MNPEGKIQLDAVGGVQAQAEARVDAIARKATRGAFIADLGIHGLVEWSPTAVALSDEELRDMVVEKSLRQIEQDTKE